MAGTGEFDILEVLGEAIFNAEDEAARTDAAPHGTKHLYRDATNIFLGYYDALAASPGWRYVTLGTTFAPADADYLVGTANAGLSAEIVAGTAPGGELGGTWGTPTVDATHSGSAHHAQAHDVPSHTGTPGGELGGTWTTPTVDTTHSGSAHHSESHALDAAAHTGTLPFTDISGTISDAQHGTVAQANAHAHSNLSGVTSDQHHAQAHTVDSHSDTTATGAELNELRDGSTTTLHGHAGGVWELAGSQTTEGTTSSLTEADVISVTGLSIAVGVPIKVVGSLRLTADGGGARQAQIGLEINSTSVVTADATNFNTAAGTTQGGAFEVYIPPRRTNYLRGLFTYAGVAATGIPFDNDAPNATITSITLRGLVSNGSAVLGADDMYVYTLATS